MDEISLSDTKRLGSLINGDPVWVLNPYECESGVPRLLDSFVCYADILGYKSLSKDALSKGNGNTFLAKLRNALSKAYESVRNEQWGGETNLFEVKVFSDNIVVGYPIINPDFDHGEGELGDILRVFSLFRHYLR